MATPPDFLGRGVRFPMGVDQAGSIALSAGRDNVQSAIRMILGTAPGERVMRPQFGCRIWDLLFEPVNANTLGRMEQAVRDAIAQWEPRVDLESVVVDPDPAQHNMLLINVALRIRATNDRRNLVFPFYVIPQEERA
jgi:phage baseplate assembly protein W